MEVFVTASPQYVYNLFVLDWSTELYIDMNITFIDWFIGVYTIEKQEMKRVEWLHSGVDLFGYILNIKSERITISQLREAVTSEIIVKLRSLNSTIYIGAIAVI